MHPHLCLKLLFRFGLLAIASLATACSPSNDPPSSAPTSARQAVPPKPQAMTSGRVETAGMPKKGLTAREVIIVEGLDATTRERILRQRELFEYRIDAEATSQRAVLDAAKVSPEAAARLRNRFAELRGNFPAPLVIDVEDRGRMRKFQSATELHEEYKDLAVAINWENLVRALKFLDKKLSDDLAELQSRMRSADGDAMFQAKADEGWLLKMGEHLQAYLALANDRIRAENELAAKRAAAASEPQTWEAYIRQYGYTLLAQISKRAVGSAYLDESGRFEAPGQGTIVLRLEYGPLSAYFLPQAEDENRVRVEDLRTWEAHAPEEPSDSAAASSDAPSS